MVKETSYFIKKYNLAVMLFSAKYLDFSFLKSLPEILESKNDGIIMAGKDHLSARTIKTKVISDKKERSFFQSPVSGFYISMEAKGICFKSTQAIIITIIIIKLVQSLS